jgi:CBS domain containing-hemolysin-like protein
METPHSFFPVCKGELDEIIGVVRARDLMADLATVGRRSGPCTPAHHPA